MSTHSHKNSDDRLNPEYMGSGVHKEIRLLQAEVERLRELGDAMAQQIERRWSGPWPCECAVCTTAKAWRENVA